MEMHAIQPKQASMSAGCIVASPEVTLVNNSSETEAGVFLASR
jgi:hypothetical protein